MSNDQKVSQLVTLAFDNAIIGYSHKERKSFSLPSWQTLIYAGVNALVIESVLFMVLALIVVARFA